MCKSYIYKKIKATAIAGIIILPLLITAATVSAAPFAFTAKILDLESGALEESQWQLPFDQIADWHTLDLGGDGNSEILFTGPSQLKTKLQLFSGNGTKINEWFAYDKNFAGQISAASGDLDGDGTPEIVTLPQAGGGPHARVFDGFGQTKASSGFFAASPNYRGQMFLDTIHTADSENILVLLSENERLTVKIFTAAGALRKQFFIEDNKTKITSVKSVDLGGDGIDEIMLASQNNSGENSITFRRQDGSLINRFNVKGGELQAGPIGLAEPGENILINLLAEGKILIYDGFGKIKRELEGRAGNLAIPIKENGQNKIILLPRRARTFAESGK